MPRLTPIDPASATGHTKTMLDNVNRSLGMTPNLMRTLAQSPAALEGYLHLSGALAKGSLNAQLREQIAIAVARVNGCDYCLSAHTLLGKLAKLEASELEAAQSADSADAKTKAALKFAVQVVKSRGNVEDGDIENVLAAGYSQGDVAEIIAHVGLNILTNYFNNAALTDIDFPAVQAVALA